MREFLPCDETSGLEHCKEILEEAKACHPGFTLSASDDDILLHALEIKVTTICTLRCRDCTHLIPYAPHPKHIPVEQIIGNLQKLLSVSRIGGLIFLGGEIFAYPHLAELFNAYKSMNMQDRVGFLRVTTNGTLVPSDAFCEAFRDIENGYVFISDYGELSTK